MAYIQDVVGIDVSKQNLDVCVLAHQQQRTVANDAVGHGELVGWLKSLGVRVAVMEASGGYEQTVAKALRRAGFDVRIVDPKRGRHFARAAGRGWAGGDLEADRGCGGQVGSVDRRSDCRDPPFAALAARLATVPGLGPVAISALIAWLPELGRLDRRQLAALVGVAPFDDDSGKRSGQRYIQGGRCKLRNILYMAVMGAATQHNPVLNAHYTLLIGRGK